MTECTQPSTPSAPCPTGSSNPAAAPSVSRRGFLSGAAVAAGAAALAGLAAWDRPATLPPWPALSRA